MKISKIKLNKAFDEMRLNKMIAFQNFSCCQTCGISEIKDYIKTIETKELVKLNGYVFYHTQDNLSMKNGSGLYLSYGHTKQLDNNRNEEVIKIGKKICEILKKYELDYEWDNNPKTKIFIKGDLNNN